MAIKYTKFAIGVASHALHELLMIGSNPAREQGFYGLKYCNVSMYINVAL
jgi:hypothetical protein